MSVGSLVRCERDSYILTRKISTGGMGIVWDAQSSVGRRVVVKSPLLNNDHDAIKIERLLIEASVLRRLNDELLVGNDELVHAHVVRYIDQLAHPSYPFLVTEYLSGEPMNEVYARKPMSESDATGQILVLLRTLGLIHSKGVVHRDVSPSNLLMSCERGMVLIDFGTSIFLNSDLGSRSGHNTRIDKRGYSAPELSQGWSDARCDIFSVGATLFFLLTGKSPADYMHNSAEGLTKPPNEVNSKISTAISDVIQKAMSADPEHRYQSTEEMIAAVSANPNTKVVPLPSLAIGGVVYELKPGSVDLGRAHACDSECKTHGFKKPLQVRIEDPQKYIEKHHARVWVTPSGECSIEDLNSVNRTAVKHSNSTFNVLKPSAREPLRDKDVVGLAYTPNRGAYMTFVFNAGRGPKPQ